GRLKTYRMSRNVKEIVASSCFRRLNALIWRRMHCRGRSREGFLRALTALVVGVLATIAALHLFVRPDPQSGPLMLGDIFAGRPVVAVLEAPEAAADPAPTAITISLTLDHTASVAAYLRDAGIDSDEAQRWSLVFQSAAATRVLSRDHPLTLY